MLYQVFAVSSLYLTIVSGAVIERSVPQQQQQQEEETFLSVSRKPTPSIIKQQTFNDQYQPVSSQTAYTETYHTHTESTISSPKASCSTYPHIAPIYTRLHECTSCGLQRGQAQPVFNNMCNTFRDLDDRDSAIATCVSICTASEDCGMVWISYMNPNNPPYPSTWGCYTIDYPYTFNTSDVFNEDGRTPVIYETSIFLRNDRVAS